MHQNCGGGVMRLDDHDVILDDISRYMSTKRK